MADEQYYVLTVKGGYDLRQHDFEIAPDGTYIFTKDQAKDMVSSRLLAAFAPVAVPAENLEKIIRQIK